MYHQDLNNILEKMRLKDVYDLHKIKGHVIDGSLQFVTTARKHDEIEKAIESKFENEKDHQSFQTNILSVIDTLDPKKNKKILEKLECFFMSLQSGDYIPLNVGSSCPHGAACYRKNPEHIRIHHDQHWTVPINEKIYKLLHTSQSNPYGGKSRKRKSIKRKSRKRKSRKRKSRKIKY